MKLFWDTNLFIYLWGDGPNTVRARSLAQWAIEQGHDVTTSALSLGEILVHPFRQDADARVESYEEAFAAMELVHLAPKVARAFAQLRATHAGLRPPDAIQLASAIEAGAEAFLTNDKRLEALDLKIPIKIIALNDWEALKS